MPLNNDHLRAIGRIVVEFNGLERNAGQAVMTLIGEGTPTIVSQALVVGESLDRLTFKLRTLVRLRLPYPDLLADLDDWIREAKKVQEDRNRVLHTGWIWFLDTEQPPDVATALRQTARDIMGQVRDYTPGDLDAIADRIRGVNQDLRRLTRRISAVSINEDEA
jgi:hypothetical protein